LRDDEGSRFARWVFWTAGDWDLAEGRRAPDGENVRVGLPGNVACDVVYDTTGPIFEVVILA
jgi:hypothetical protein